MKYLLDRVNQVLINDLSTAPDGFYLTSAWFDEDYNGCVNMNGTEPIIENMWATTGGPTIALSSLLTNVPCSWCLKIGDNVLSMNHSRGAGGFGKYSIGLAYVLIDDLKQLYPEIQTYDEARHAIYLDMVKKLDQSITVSSPNNDKRIEESTIVIPEYIKPYNALYYGENGKMTIPYRLYVKTIGSNNYVYMNAIYVDSDPNLSNGIYNDYIKDFRQDYIGCTETGSFEYMYADGKTLIVEANDVVNVYDDENGTQTRVKETEITYHLNDGSTPRIIFAYSINE